MAKNSIREQILVYHETNIVKRVGVIANVIRVLPTVSDLQQFATTQFPLLAIVGGLPVPTEKVSARDGSKVDVIISELTIKNFVYLQERENVDSIISEVADDMWKKCYADETYGGLALTTLLSFEEDVVYYDPFVAFLLVSKIKYKHNSGGI